MPISKKHIARKKHKENQTITSRRRFGSLPSSITSFSDEVSNISKDASEFMGTSYIEDLRVDELNDSFEAILSTVKGEIITKEEVKKIGNFCRLNSRYNDLIVHNLIENNVPQKVGTGQGEFFDKYFGWPSYTVSKMNKRASTLIALSSEKYEDWPDVKDAHLDELAKVGSELGKETMVECFNEIKQKKSGNGLEDISVPLISQTVEKLVLERELGVQEMNYFKTASEEINASRILKQSYAEPHESADDLTCMFEEECLRVNQEFDALVAELADINQRLEKKVGEISVLSDRLIKSTSC